MIRIEPMTIEVYVHKTEKCDGMMPQEFVLLSAVWEGRSLILPFGPEEEEREVVGWTPEGLNALSGIGCVRTLPPPPPPPPVVVGLNALSGIGCVRTQPDRGDLHRRTAGLNALSGIGCVRTIAA